MSDQFQRLQTLISYLSLDSSIVGTPTTADMIDGFETEAKKILSGIPDYTKEFQEALSDLATFAREELSSGSERDRKAKMGAIASYLMYHAGRWSAAT